MAGDPRKRARYLGLKDGRPALRRLPLGICFCFLIGLLCAGPARSAEDRGAPALSSGRGAQIAIADFDGDRYPDLASIQTGASDGSRTNYCIRLSLTSAGQQSIQVVGPMGGLEIAARDVNGDHAIDLVLTAALFRQPVAILLNDGHGNFSAVEPSAYPGAFEQSEANWGAAEIHVSLAAVDPGQKRAAAAAPGEGLRRYLPQSPFLPLPSSRVSFGHFLSSYASRAPPSGISQL